jgi:hypothetical protein
MVFHGKTGMSVRITMTKDQDSSGRM